MNDLVQFLPILALLLLFWFLVLRPARVRQRDFKALQDSLETGQRVMMSSGIFGDLVSLDDETAQLRIAPDTVVTVVRAAIARIDTETMAPGPDTD